MKFMHKYYHYIIFAFGIFILSCANTADLSGGIKDVEPPVVTKSLPENQSRNFDKKSIQLSFNEFVKLNNINQQLLISPPFAEKPEFKLRGKNIIIDLKDSLKANTTYTMFFGDAIVDITEANPISGYSYVFSTGDELDSMMIRGFVNDAFSTQPSPDVFVCLYRNHEDTVPFRTLPDYIAKTAKDGSFVLSNLSAGEYKIFAISDANSNYKFDLPTESIAFSDTLIIPEIKVVETADTLFKKTSDTTELSKEIDTIKFKKKTKYLPENISLRLFAENSKKQFISKKTRDLRQKAEVVFNLPVYDSLSFKTLGVKDEGYIIEKSTLNDTIVLWLTDSTLINMDSLGFIFNYFSSDSLENQVPETDTIFLVYKEINLKKKKNEIEKVETIKPELKLTSGIQHFNKPLKIVLPSPIEKVDETKLRLFYMEDTSKIKCDFEIKKDTLNQRLFTINYKWKENYRYILYVDSLAFTDYYGVNCDSVEFSFNTQSTEEYGTFVLNLTGISKPVILQMLDKGNKNVLKEIYIQKNKKLKFTYLQPQEINFRVIIDENGNKRYDTGKYIFHRQPEIVKYFPKNITIKANWEIEEDWNLND